MGEQTPAWLLFRDATGALVARPFGSALDALAAEFGPDAWSESLRDSFPGSDPVGDAARTLAAHEGLDYVGVECTRVAGRWASWDEEREHLRRTDPDTFAKLENVEQAPSERRFEPWDRFAPRQIERENLPCDRGGNLLRLPEHIIERGGVQRRRREAFFRNQQTRARKGQKA